MKKETQLLRLNQNISAILGIPPAKNLKLDGYEHQTCMSGELNTFYGQKHTEESKTQMSISAKARPCNRKGVTLSKKTKQLISLNNAAAKKIKTPYGEYRSKVEAAKALDTITEAIRSILNERLDSPVKQAGKLFTVNDIGKTPRELGWDYV